MIGVISYLKHSIPPLFEAASVIMKNIINTKTVNFKVFLTFFSFFFPKIKEVVIFLEILLAAILLFKCEDESQLKHTILSLWKRHGEAPNQLKYHILTT